MAKRFKKLMALLLGTAVLVSSAPEAALAAAGESTAVESPAVSAEEPGEIAENVLEELVGEGAEEPAGQASVENAGSAETQAESTTVKDAAPEAEAAGNDTQNAAPEAEAAGEDTQNAAPEAEEKAADGAKAGETAFAGEDAPAAKEEAFAGENAPAAKEEAFAGEETLAADPEAWQTDEVKSVLLDDDFKTVRFTFTPENDGNYIISVLTHGENGELYDVFLCDTPDFEDLKDAASIDEGYVFQGLSSGHTYGIELRLFLDDYGYYGKETWTLKLSTYELPRLTVDGNGGYTENGKASYFVEIPINEVVYLDDVIFNHGSFEREGYRLLGWAEDPAGTEPMDPWCFSTGQEKTYYAIWEEIPVVRLGEAKTFIYDTENDTGAFQCRFVPEEDGWYVFSVDATENDNSYLIVYDDITFNSTYSIYLSSWNPKQAKLLKKGKSYGIETHVNEGPGISLMVTVADTFVTLDGNGGMLEDGTTVQDIAVLENDHFLYQATERAEGFVREGYRRTGWATTPDGEDADSEYSISLEKEKTYYAVWNRLVSVTCHANGTQTGDGKEAFLLDDALEGRPVSEYNSYSWRFTPPTGKSFAGWALTPDAEKPDPDAVLSDGLDLYAVWETAYYTISLSANDGYFAVPTENWFQAGGYYGKKMDVLPSDIPTSNVKGKVFDKWYYDYDCTQPFEGTLSEFSPTQSLTLYAGYKDDGSQVSKLTLNKTSASVLIGKALTLKATAAPKTALNKAVSWSSSNKKVATVSAKGVVKGIAKGTVTITAKARDGSGVKASCKVTVKIPVETVKLNKTKAAVLKGKTLTLKATAGPKTAALRTVTWSSSNKKVATVSAKGVVKGIAKGTAVITAKAKDGSGVKAACKITVRQPVTKLTPGKTALTVAKGKTVTLKVTAAPKSADNKAVSFTSSNKKVATVSAKGVIKGIANGSAVITVKAKDGSGTTVKCKVTVK